MKKLAIIGYASLYYYGKKALELALASAIIIFFAIVDAL